MQSNYSTPGAAVNTNKIGAFVRVGENGSQRDSVKIVDNIYNVEFVDSIQQNQMIGDTPNYCIPLSINAITVQGISYSDPYFSSFNLNYKMAFGAPKYANKSDYAFKSSVCIIRDEPYTDKTQLLNEKAAHNMICKTKTRMIEAAESARTHHDNNAPDVTEASTPKMAEGAVGGLSFDALLELVRNEERVVARLPACERDSWGVPRRLRLRGGGESSLNAASGWGSPPASNNAGNWGGNATGQANNGSNNTQQQWNNTAQRPPTSQADMNSKNGNQMPPSSGASSWQSNAANMPNSPPNNNAAPANNGTNNAGNGNNGGNNPANPAANTNGPSPPNGTNGNGNSNSSAKIEQLNSMREALYSQDGWGGQHVNQDTNWDVPGSPEPGSKVEPAAAGGPVAWKPNVNNGAFLGTDLWEANLRNGGQPPPQPQSKTPWGHTPTTNIGGTWGEDDDAADSNNVWAGPPPQQWPAGPPQHAQQWAVPKKDDWNTWGEPGHRGGGGGDPRMDPRAPDPRQPPADPRHDLRGGISGRLNGDMWTQHQHHAAGPNKMMPAGGVNQWGAQGPKESMKGAGWEEPSPPAARRAAGGFDDGTSLWQRGGGMGMGGRAPPGPAPPPRVPPTPTKPEGGVWGHSQRNGSWEEPHVAAGAWPDRDVQGWPEAAGPASGWPGGKPKPGPGGTWPDDIGEWPGPKPPQSLPLGKPLPKEMVWNSKQFRYLVEMGYKKEEAEAALRSRDMNAEEALELLAAARGEPWRRDDHYGHHGGPFQPPPAVPSVSPAVVQKLLNQPPPQPHQHHPYNSNSGTGNSGQPSQAQLRMLVQQIQMAVSAGYLNHQILNQPLAPQTLMLLNQLLQQIKILQQLVQQHSLAIKGANSSLALQYSVQITKAKQQITALQNQIATQQALYMKQQAGGADLFKQSHDPLASLQNDFRDLSLAKDPQAGYGASGNQQSRLNQWKLPSLDKDGEGSEFSRAPGTAKSATSPQLNQLGLQPDSTWGVGRGGEGWGEAGADVADGKDWPAHSHQPVYDLVPEFEPGKPWKGNQMKNVEDDPAMTPGSVVRSPLSLAAIKDNDMLGGKTSPPGGERSLSSSTWSYAPPATSAGVMKPPADAWGAKPRPAPPGLNKAWPQHHGGNVQQRLPSWQASTWLLLKNLTAQIDGSTLKTLCVQHGPLQNFHLYLNQGFALARYSTREEAAKAQMALNNCVLSNTTIFAESPAESEVQMILQHLGSGGGGAWRGGKDAWGGGGGGVGGVGFPNLWPEQHEQRATPSSLNSFLPPDLLGGESI